MTPLASFKPYTSRLVCWFCLSDNLSFFTKCSSCGLCVIPSQKHEKNGSHTDLNYEIYSYGKHTKKFGDKTSDPTHNTAESPQMFDAHFQHLVNSTELIAIRVGDNDRLCVLFRLHDGGLMASIKDEVGKTAVSENTSDNFNIMARRILGL